MILDMKIEVSEKLFNALEGTDAQKRLTMQAIIQNNMPELERFAIMVFGIQQPKATNERRAKAEPKSDAPKVQNNLF